MKIRTDFVTNSSSSSFVCLGIEINELKIPDKFYLDYFSENIKADHYLSQEEINEMDDNRKVEYVKNECSHYDLFYNLSSLDVGGYDHDIIGITVSTLLDRYKDKQVGDLRQIVADEINKQFNTNFTAKDIEYFELSWQDG